MSWRNSAQRTGMNAQPLGNTRRWGSGASSGIGAGGYERAPPKRSYDYDMSRASHHEGARKRRSRWGDESDRKDASSAAITGNVSGQELDRYAIQVRLDEILSLIHI